MNLPKAVHRVIARSREYFYYQDGRGTSRQGPRIKLPNDPQSPEFWAAIRQAQGLTSEANNGTVKAVTDLFIEHCEKRVGAGDLSDGTLYQYRRSIKLACDAWGSLQANGLRPVHVQTIIDGFGATPGKANNFLGCMRALSTWARARDKIDASITEGVEPFKVTGGHKPWTPEQIKAALSGLTGVIRKGVILYMFTGMRGSDAVRLGWTDIDDGGFLSRHRSASAMSGVRSCLSCRRRWRHGKSVRGHFFCRRMDGPRTSPTPVNCSRFLLR